MTRGENTEASWYSSFDYENSIHLRLLSSCSLRPLLFVRRMAILFPLQTL